MGPLTSPDAFFQRESTDARLVPPAALVLLTAILGLVSQYIVFSSVFSSLGSGSDAAGFANIIMVVSMAISFVGAFVIWFVYAGLFYLLSMIFDGEGSFSTTFKLVGWGYLPSVISGAVSAVAYLVFLNGGMTLSSAGFATSASSLLNGPILITVTVVGLVFTLWQGLLFTFGVKHARNLSTQQAAIVVAPLILLSIAGSVFTLVSSVI